MSSPQHQRSVPISNTGSRGNERDIDSGYFVIGANHQSAGIEVREKISRFDLLSAVKRSNLKHIETLELALVRTCNRFDIFGYSKNINADLIELRNVISGFLNEKTLKTHMYVFSEKNAIQHLMRVTSSLDAMVIGETQITGQVKQCFTNWRNAGFSKNRLQIALDAALRCAKEIRTETNISQGNVSISSIAIDLATHIFPSFIKTPILVVGAGHAAATTIRALVRKGATQIALINRDLSRAKLMATACAIQPAYISPLEDLEKALDRSDIIVSATSSQIPIILKKHLVESRRTKGGNPRLFLDLAVPRDIEDGVGSLPDTYLYNVDQLQSIANADIKNRKADVDKAKRILIRHLDAFFQKNHEQQYGPLIQMLRNSVYQTTCASIDRYAAQHQFDEDSISRLSNDISKRLLHPILTALKQHGKKAMRLEEALPLLFNGQTGQEYKKTRPKALGSAGISPDRES